MKTLRKELKKELEQRNASIETLFIGGGTPSCIQAKQYQEIFEILSPYWAKNAEITTEANPNSATSQWLEEMFSYGVNRISFGVQSFNDEKLAFLGRAHSAQKAEEAIIKAHAVGFKKINCDLIYGVFNDTFESLKKDMDTLNRLPIDHVSAYSLIIEEGTPFFNQSRVKIDDEILSGELFEYLDFLGFKQYEISNFAKQLSSQSQHNIGYWKHKEYLGIGAGAVGYIEGKRVYGTKNIEHYIKNPFLKEEESLSQEEIKMEKVLLGLRCYIGVECSLLSQKESQKVQDLVQNGQLFLKNNRFFAQNYLIADELALYILE